MVEVQNLIEELESHRATDAETSTARRAEFQERDRTLARIEVALTEKKQAQAQQQLEKDTLVEEGRELSRSLAQLDAQVKDDEESSDRIEERRASLQSRLDEVEQEISEKEGELMGLLPEWEEKTASLEDARQSLSDVKARLAILLAKGGRSAQFQTQAQRDAALQEQVGQLQAVEKTQSDRSADVEATREEIRRKLDEVEKTMQARQEQLDERKKIKEDSSTAWSEKKARREELAEKKKELWKEETKLSSSVAFAREQLNVSQRALGSMMDKATAQGLQAIERIAREQKLTGVYGPLFQLFSVDSTYQTATEVTAGNSLFHVVVDTDETASKVLDVMNREKAGRVTFMPLNRLSPKDQTYPNTAEAIPLLNRLKFDRRFAPAMKQVFGKMIVCPDLELAGAYVRSHGLNAITLEGDKVEKRGALTGGYHDPRRSRLDTIRQVKKWREVLDGEAAQLDQIKQSTLEMEQDINTLTAELQTLEARIAQATSSRVPLQEELQYLRGEEIDVKAQLKAADREYATVQRDLRAAQTEREALEAEIQTPMQQGLSAEEQAERDDLYTQEDALTKQANELSARVAELTSTKDSLQIDIDELLKRERDSLSGQLEDIGENLVGSAPAGGSNADARRGELDRIRQQRDDRKARVEELEAELEAIAKEVQKIQEEHDAVYAEQLDTARQIEKHQKSIDRYISKRQRLQEQKDKCNAHIRDLGVLPEEAYDKYTNFELKSNSMDRLVKRLHKVNEALKEFSGVNKKAVEQYNNFTKQRDQLTQRQSELEKSAESIQELIEVLDQRKDEAIERTFKQVSKNFEEVFARLVPAGRGRLIMQKRIDRAEGSDDEDEEQGGSSIDNYAGVSIKVSFNSKVDEGLRIQQLSGGQKSLVALATVFAIQKCDPAPFYLFDEIDANLDAQYRTAVAAMIEELSATAQFITTTFRGEMVQVAAKHYGVTFDASKVSNIRTITQGDASDFVDAAAAV